MTASAEVVVVGGGIAGGALATVLARGGLDVVVLERQTVYRDKVRGEVFLPWGVAEARSLGLEQVLLDAGGGYATRLGRFEEWIRPEEAESQAIPLDRLLPGVPGSLNVGHPQACEALVGAAEAAGARVVRGVGEITLGADRSSRSTSSTTSTTRSIAAWWWGPTAAGQVSAARPGSTWRSRRRPAWPGGCS